MTISLNKDLFEKQVKDELLHVCGLRSSEFKAFASNLESFQLLEKIIETSALIDAADSPPLIDVVKQHKCEWSVLQAQMVSLLEVRFGPRVSSGFINIVSSLESSQLTFYELIDALKFVSEDGLRLLVNLIFASSLYPRVNSQLLNVSGGVGRSLSKVTKFSSVENKAHFANLREVLDATGGKAEVQDHIHDLKTKDLLHSERNSFIHQDDVVPNTVSNKEKTFTKELKQDNQFLNQGTVNIDSHSNHDNAENYTLKSATELPSLSVSQVREEIRDRLQFIGWSLGNKQTMVGGEEDKGEQSPLLLHNERLGTTIHTDNPNIQSQLENIQTDFNIFCKEVVGLKHACSAIRFVRDEIARAPKDLKDIFTYDAVNDLSPETLRESNRLFQKLSAISTKLGSLDSPHMVNEFQTLQNIDQHLIQVDSAILACRGFIKSVIENPDELKAVENLDEAIKHLGGVKIDMEALRNDAQFLTDAETLNQIIEFKSSFGPKLENINNWAENHPQDIAQITVMGNDQDLQRLSEFFENRDEFFSKYNLAGKALIKGHLIEYTDALNRIGKLLGDFKVGFNDIRLFNGKQRVLFERLKSDNKDILKAIVESLLPKQVELVKTLEELQVIKNDPDLNDIKAILTRAQEFEQTFNRLISSDDFYNLKYYLRQDGLFSAVGQLKNVVNEMKKASMIINDTQGHWMTIRQDFDAAATPILQEFEAIKNEENRILTQIRDALPKTIWAEFCDFFAGIWRWMGLL